MPSRGSPVPGKRALLPALLLAAFVSAGLVPLPEASFLVKADWQNANELARIASCEGDVRHWADSYVLLSVTQAQLGRLCDLRLNVSVLDTTTAQTQYYLVGPRSGFEAQVAGLAKPVLQDSHNRLLLSLQAPPSGQQGVLEKLAAWCYFAYALPHRFSLDGWLPGVYAARPVYTPERSPAVSALLDSVSAARLEGDLAHLAYYDIAKGNGGYNNDLSNLRTRYARHPDCRDSAAAYIAAELADAIGADAVELIEFRHTPDEVPMYNIVGLLEGSDPGAGYYVLCGHYDSIGCRSTNPDGSGWNWRTDPAPGADDNGTAVACALEAARVLAQVELSFDVRFVFFSGEELHLWGSQAYVEEASQNGDEIIGVLNLDMVGYNNRYDKLDIVANPTSSCIMTMLAEMNELYDIGLLLFEKYDSGFPSSDHWMFWGHGYEAIWATEHLPPWEDDPDGYFRANAQYHTYNDVVDSLNLSLVHKTAQLCVAALAHCGLGAPLAACTPQTGPLFEVYAYPNPCSADNVWFHYQLSELSDVTVHVYTSVGEEVWDQMFDAGKDGARLGGTGNNVGWRCADLASGLYVYKITAFVKTASRPAHFVLGKLAIAR